MSIAGIKWAQEMRGVCPYRKALLFALGERHYKDTDTCCPDQEKLALDAGMSARTVRKYIAMLIADGLITRDVKATKHGRVAHYTLNLHLTEPQPVEGVRQTVPLASEGGSGTQLPDGSGTCVPLHKNTTLHDSSVSKETAKASNSKPSRPKPEKSEAEAKASLTTKSELQKAGIYSVGVALLKAEGIEDQVARRFLGSLIKKSSVAIVHAAIQAASQDPPIDARGFLSGVVEKRARQAGMRRAPEAKPGQTPTDVHGEPVDWSEAVERYRKSGWWNSKKLGERPDELRYRGPLKPLEALLATGRFGGLDVRIVRINIDRLRAEQSAA